MNAACEVDRLFHAFYFLAAIASRQPTIRDRMAPKSVEIIPPTDEPSTSSVAKPVSAPVHPEAAFAATHRRSHPSNLSLVPPAPASDEKPLLSRLRTAKGRDVHQRRLEQLTQLSKNLGGGPAVPR